MNIDEEFEVFMEFPDSLDKRFVTSTSAKLFAKHCVDQIEKDSKLDRLKSFVSSDATAISFQSLGQYRAAMLKMLNT